MNTTAEPLSSKTLATSTARPAKKFSAEQRKEIVKILMAVSTVLGESPNPDRVDLLIQMIQQIPFEVLKPCLETWAQRHNWFPKPFEVIHECTEAPKKLAASDQWDRIMLAASRMREDEDFGYSELLDSHLRSDYEDELKLNPTAAYALRQLGGLEAVRRIKPEHIGLLCDRFLASYELESGRAGPLELPEGSPLKQLISKAFGKVTGTEFTKLRTEGD